MTPFCSEVGSGSHDSVAVYGEVATASKFEGAVSGATVNKSILRMKQEHQCEL